MKLRIIYEHADFAIRINHVRGTTRSGSSATKPKVMKLVTLQLSPDSRTRLLARVPPIFLNKFTIKANHVTLAFDPPEAMLDEYRKFAAQDRRVVVNVMSSHWNREVQAVKVRWLPEDIVCLNLIPHITIALFGSAQSVEANQMLVDPMFSKDVEGLVLDTKLVIEDREDKLQEPRPSWPVMSVETLRKHADVENTSFLSVGGLVEEIKQKEGA